MRSDYKVDYRREQNIKEIAAALLSAYGVARSGGRFDITKFVETTLVYYCKKKRKAELRVFLFDRANKYDEPANVIFGHGVITLYIDRRIWADARIGDEYSRFVIAHEIGHIVLHDHDAKAFSSDLSLRIKFAGREHSAEWQADTLAEHFLVPDEAAKRYPNEGLLSTMCGVSLALARKRLNAYFSERGLLVESPCKCGNYSLVREETNLRCFVCGRRVQTDTVK